MMFRATHIYILMSALINLMTWNYLRHYAIRNYVKVRALASILILMAPFLFLAAFIVEPPTYQIERAITISGVVVLLTGVLLHSLFNLKWPSKKTS